MVTTDLQCDYYLRGDVEDGVEYRPYFVWVTRRPKKELIGNHTIQPER